MFKKGLVLTIVLLLSMSLLFLTAGCGQKTAGTDENKSQQQEKTIVDKIKERGKIVIATCADYPPYEFHDLKGGKDEIVGFDIDIAKAIADELGVELEIQDMTFDGILPALLANQIDLAIAAFTITEERKKSVDFSDPYFDGGQRILTYKGSGVENKNDLIGKTIAVQVGTTGEEEAKKIEGANLVQFNQVTEIALELVNKRVDAAIVGSVVAEAYAKTHDSLIAVGDLLNSEQNGIPVRKEDKELLAVVNKVIADLKADGTYDKLVKKWFIDFNPEQ